MTGAIVKEHNVDGNATDDVCKKLNDSQYNIDGTDITLPVQVNSASMLLNTYIVDAKTVAKIIQGTGYKPLIVWPGKAILQLLAVDYKENDLGNYNEGAIIFPVITPQQKCFPLLGAWFALAKGTACNYVYRMPVNQSFTTHAGRFIWGFPKWSTQMDVEFGDSEAQGCFQDNNQLVYTIHAATGGNISFNEQKSPSVTVRNNKAWKTYGVSTAEGATFKMGGKQPDIGNEHPLALELRSLGLPKKPFCTISAKKVSMRFNGPECVNIGEKFTS